MSARPQAYLDPPARPPFAFPKPPPGRELISLAINESPFGASPRAIAAARARLDRPHRYPDPSNGEFKAAIGAAHGLDPGRIVCGNGSEELIDIVARAFARPGDEIVMAQSGFFQFALAAQRTGASLVRASEENHAATADGLLSAVTPRTKIVFLATPNNPTGSVMPLRDVRDLAARLASHVVLVLDLAYGEYLAPAEIAGLMALDGDNIVKTRTFSKAYGLAALRAGWAHVPLWTVPALELLRGVGNVNAVAQAAAIEAIADRAFLDRVVARTAGQRRRLEEALDRLALNYIAGRGNFVMTRFPGDRTAADFARLAMAEEGIWLRPASEPGFENWCRLGLGTDAQTGLLTTLLERFLMTGGGRLK